MRPLKETTYCASFVFDLGVRGNHTITKALSLSPKELYHGLTEDQLKVVRDSEARKQVKFLLENEFLEHEEDQELTFYPILRLVKVTIFTVDPCSNRVEYL